MKYPKKNQLSFAPTFSIQLFIIEFKFISLIIVIVKLNSLICLTKKTKIYTKKKRQQLLNNN